MTRPIAVLRPEPGNRVTAAAIEARGRTAIRMPLFEARPVAWDAPLAEAFDALILTSANALRQGGAGLSALHRLPVYAVGKPTAEAARRSGFAIAATGERGADEIVAKAEGSGVRRALHLAGREHTLSQGGIVAQVVTVYASDPCEPHDVQRLAGSIALAQSARAAARLGEVVDAAGLDRGGIAVIAISARAADAAGMGWQRIVMPGAATSEAMIDAALALAD